MVLKSLRRRATSDGLPVYLVGGPVRDAVLGAPVKDLDFVVVGDAPALAEELAIEVGGLVTAHPRFGTATVEIDGGRADLVTARKESYPFPGSLPEVSASTLDDDLARRDFSINAMALPLSGDSAKVIDPHGGIQDLGSRSVRTLHPGSFADDPTRMLRAVRYEQRLGFQIADGTLSELRQALAGGYVAAVTGDRWRQELQKIFEEDRAIAMLVRAIELGVLAAVHPALSDGQALKRLAAQNGSGLPAPSAMDLLAALTVSLSPADGDLVSRRLNLPAAWARVVRDTIALRVVSPALSGPSVRPSVVCRALDGLDSAAIAASARLLKDPQVRAQIRRYLEEWRSVEAALTGNDLLAMGVPPGPKIGQVLRELTSAKLDGLAGSEEEERVLVDRIMSRGS
jgi:tRNA nucleotidyltransferase (CCA-adding enzyme)